MSNNDIVEAQPSRLPAASPAPAAGPLAMAMQAMQAGMSVADMRDMLNLQKDWEANEARKAYVQAMSEFKRNPPDIYKRKVVEFSGTRYSHATLGDVTQAIMQSLAEYGISHRWDTRQNGAQIVVTCILTHEKGHSESTTLEGSPDDSGKKNRIQQMASTVTYLQRYTLLAATGLATKDVEDDDGRDFGDPVEGPVEMSEYTTGWIEYIKSLDGDKDKVAEAVRRARGEYNKARDLVGLKQFNTAVAAL